MRWPRFWGKRDPALPRGDPDPGTPHEFKQIDDPGMGAMAASGSQRGTSIAQVAVTDNFVRKSRCGVPGCGKERSDPIHHGGED
jgi:hypothetical protein